MTLSKKLVQHRNAAHKLTLTAPQVILSCGEDGVVNEIDLRIDRPVKLLLVKEADKKVALYSIHSTQQHNPEQFVVCGRSPYVHLYDRRFLTVAQCSPAPLEKFCPPHLKTTKHTVTCAVFDSIGKSILATYNDDDMYLFDSRNGELEHTYKGHRNSATVKGCSWFSDDFVLSGSDDGYIYGWDRESEHIVMSLYADENGVVNCLEPHPTCPFLATSGLDDNVKIWVPSSYQWPQTMKGIKNVSSMQNIPRPH
jgi:WD repeat-containing protein 42A